VPVITTGTYALGVVSLEELSEERGIVLHGETDTLKFNKATLEGEPVYALGVGWRKGITTQKMEASFCRFINEHSPLLPAVIATAEVKEEEVDEVLLTLAKRLGSALAIVPNEVLNAFPGPSPSRAEEKLGVVGVAEPAALAVLPQGEILVSKVAIDGVTFALAKYRR